jgi:hypothetical protein
MTFAKDTSCFGLACLFLTLTCHPAAAQDCRTIAAPPPLATLDGPATVERGESEMALGAGFGGTLFDCTHKTGSAWFGRMRRGLTDRLDLGADLLVAQHQDKGTATAKIALRYRLRERLRLEAGVGGADDSDGKSLNADIAITTGTIRNTTWNCFASLRVAMSSTRKRRTACQRASVTPVHGEFYTSRRRRRLIEPVTVPLPPTSSYGNAIANMLTGHMTR